MFDPDGGIYIYIYIYIDEPGDSQILLLIIRLSKLGDY